MAAIRVSDEELKADLEKLETYLSSLCKLNVNSSSKVNEMKDKYVKILKRWFKLKKTKNYFSEDLKTSDIICDQSLKDFFNENLTPIR